MSENPVVVDHQAIAAEAERVELPPDSSEPANSGIAPAAEAGPGGGGAAAASPPASWTSLCPGIVSAVDLFICPNWQLKDDEKRELAAALGPALDQLFPGGIGDERWAPYFRVLLVATGIVATRYDRAAGRFKPLRAKAKPAPGSTAGDEPEQRGSFSIGAGVASN